MPREILEALKLKSNDEISITIEGDSIIISRAPKNLGQMLSSMNDGEKFSEADTGSDVKREFPDE